MLGIGHGMLTRKEPDRHGEFSIRAIARFGLKSISCKGMGLTATKFLPLLIPAMKGIVLIVATSRILGRVSKGSKSKSADLESINSGHAPSIMESSFSNSSRQPFS